MITMIIGYRKGITAPNAFEDSANEQPRPSMIGLRVPQINVSPMPASGPIRPVLIPTTDRKSVV